MIIEKKANTTEPINKIIAKRWSTRAFNSEKKITRQKILAICEAAHWAPSCSNDQPWRFLIFNKNEDAESWQKAFELLSVWNQRWVKNVPVLIIAFADDKFRKEGEPNRWGQFDTGAACMNIYLQAVSMGLMAHPMGGFDLEKVKFVFSIPDNFTPMAFIAVGCQADADILEGKYKKNELDERTRFPLGDSFFDSAWGKPIK